MWRISLAALCVCLLATQPRAEQFDTVTAAEAAALCSGIPVARLVGEGADRGTAEAYCLGFLQGFWELYSWFSDPIEGVQGQPRDWFLACLKGAQVPDLIGVLRQSVAEGQGATPALGVLVGRVAYAAKCS